MKFFVIALALIGVVASDVSHLHLAHDAGYSYGAPSSHSSASSSSSSSSSASFSSLSDPLPGGDSSSYQPAHLIPQQLQAAQVSINLGADTQTPEQFIPVADRIVHAQQAQVVPGGDSSSYQPAHLIPQHLKASHAVSTSAQVIPGGDSSSYQPAHLIPQQLQASQVSVSQSFNLGADTQTPEQFIPEADRIVNAQQAQLVVPGGDSSSYQPAHLIPQHLKASHVLSTSAQVVPGGDSSSYQPEHLIPQHLQDSAVPQTFNIGADTHTPEQFIPEADRIAHTQYVQQQEQSPVAIGANTITPAHLYQEQVSNGIEEFNAETHVPVAIGRDTVTPAHLLAKLSAGHDTQYGSNGGYVY